MQQVGRSGGVTSAGLAKAVHASRQKAALLECRQSQKPSTVVPRPRPSCRPGLAPLAEIFDDESDPLLRAAAEYQHQPQVRPTCSSNAVPSQKHLEHNAGLTEAAPSAPRKRRKFADTWEASLYPLGMSWQQARAKCIEFVEVPRYKVGRAFDVKKKMCVEIEIVTPDALTGALKLKVTGPDLAVKNAIELINATDPFRHPRILASECDETLEIPRCKVQKIQCQTGRQLMKIVERSGARIDIDKDCDPCKVRIQGDKASFSEAKEMILMLTKEATVGATEYFFFPRGSSKAILGKDGSRLSFLQEASGACIDVDESAATLCKVRFSGTAAQVERAKHLVTKHALVQPL